MTDKDLYYFKTIADEKSITAAARKLYVAQPSLSQFLKKLETSLGISLFHRNASGLTLTYAGERYYHMAVKVLKIYENFEFEVSDINNLKAGRVHVGATRHLGSIMLPEVLSRFHELCPNIEVQISELTTERLEEELLAGRLDFALMHAPTEDKRNPSLSYELLYRDPFVVAMQQDSPLLALAVPQELLPDEEKEPDVPLPVLDLKYLNHASFIMTGRGQRIRQINEHVLKKAGIDYEISLELSSQDTILRCTAAGLGAAIVPYNYTQLFNFTTPPAFCAIPKSYGAGWDQCITTSNEFYRSKADELFMRIVRDTFGRSR